MKLSKARFPVGAIASLLIFTYTEQIDFWGKIGYWEHLTNRELAKSLVGLTLFLVLLSWWHGLRGVKNRHR